MVYPLWAICNEERRFIVLISDTATQAESFLAAIKHELETNERLREHYGDLVGVDKWTNGDLITKNNIRVIARGTGASLRGLRHLDTRPDLVIGDDLENDQMVRTSTQRKKIWEWFTKALINTIAEHGKIVMVGTILHYDSLLNNLLKHDHWNTKKFSALDADNNPLWPDVWSYERLMARKKDIGSLAFQSEFMNEPIDDDTAIVKYDWLRFYDELPEDLDIYGFVDPAISQKDTADYFALCTIGHHKQTGNIYVLDMVRDRITFASQVQRVSHLNERYKYVRFGVESVAYQQALYQEIRRVDKRVPVVPIKIDKDKTRRLMRVSPLVENGTIYFRKEHTDFIEELVRFPKAEHDDTVDAFTGAVGLVLEQKKPSLSFI